MAALGLIVAAPFFAFWYWYQRDVVWQSWTVPIAGHGTIEYQNRSPQMHFLGPSDSTKVLIWHRPFRRPVEYTLGMPGSGAGYVSLEVRQRADGHAIWLLAPDFSEKLEVVGTLDFSTGRFTGAGGTGYDPNGEQSTDWGGTPKWATLTGGRVIAWKAFR
jgi:hypothetical protein